MGEVKVTQAARAKARERRAALDRDRAERDARIETAATAVFAATAARAAAEQQRQDAEAAIGAGLEQMLGEGLRVTQVAEYCELTLGEVQRLTRRRREATGPTVATVRLPRGTDPRGTDQPETSPAAGRPAGLDELEAVVS